MNPSDIIKALLWLAALGVVVIVGTRVASRVGSKAGSVLPG